MKTYIAYRYGKKNQSFIMKDEKNESVFEANLVKFHFFTASDYEFVNKKTGDKQAHKVGKTKTTRQGFGGVNFTTSSSFKLDKINCFDILAKKGLNFRIIAKIDLVHPEFGLYDSANKLVVSYKMNQKGERQENVHAIGKSQRNTIISTDSDDIETIFLGAYILSRVDFSTYLM